MKAALLLVLALQQAPYDLVPRPELRPGTTYDASIPTLAEVVGHDLPAPVRERGAAGAGAVTPGQRAVTRAGSPLDRSGIGSHVDRNVSSRSDVPSVGAAFDLQEV